MTPIDLISRKRDGREHTEEELRALVAAVMDGSMADYQIAAWLMAAFLNGLSSAEVLALSLAMRDSGERVDWSGVEGVKLDKHSSGGVGDKVTPVVVPILAAAGVPMLKMSGRGLGHAGGTVDKLESIPGFRTDLTAEDAREQVRRIGAALIGQSPSLAPADKKLYALRDVTATVESLPLIASSIMSKKLAAGADCLLLDVKVGSGAYLKKREEAEALARLMVDIGKGAGVRIAALLTDMDEPLGYAVGNALEIAEACAVLTDQGRVDDRFRDLCITLAAHGLVLTGHAGGEDEARGRVEDLLRSGEAANKLEEIIAAQGGDSRVVRETSRLPHAPHVRPIPALSGGYVNGIDAAALGWLSMAMGAGRMRKEDPIDPAVGIVLHKKAGDRVETGEPLAELHMRADSAEWDDRLHASYTISDRRSESRPVLIGLIH